MTAKENTINAGDNGIQVAGGGTVNVTANGGNNTITAVNNGIEVANGTLNVTANEKNDITAGVTGINVVGNSNAYVDGKEITITVVKNVQDTSPTTDMAAGINLGKKEGSIAKFGNLILGSNNDIKNNKFVIDVTNNNDSKYSSAVGINVTQNSTLRTENAIGDVSIIATNANGRNATGIYVNGSTFDVSANSFNITSVDGATSQSNAEAKGIAATTNANVKIDAVNGIIINAENKNVSNFNKNTTAIEANMSTVHLDAGSDIVLNYIQDKDDVQQLASEINKLEKGIFVGQQGSVVLTSQNNEINAMSGVVSTGANPAPEGGTAEAVKGAVILNAENANNINATQFGIDVDGQNQGENAAKVELNAKQNNIYVYADTGSSTYGTGIEASYDGSVKIANNDKQADITNIVVNNMNDVTYLLRGVDVQYNANVDIDSDIINLSIEDTVERNYDVENVGIYAYANGKVNFSAKDIILNVENGIGVQSSWGSNVNLNSDRIVINAYDSTGIAASNNTWQNMDNIVKLDANESNTVRAGEFLESEEILGAGYGNKKAINAWSGSEVSLSAGEFNNLAGAVYATGVDSTTKEATVVNINSNANNYVLSSAVIANAGDLDSKEKGGMDIVSALYAEEGANINLSGINNIQTYYDDPEDTHTSERAVWAYKGANINIDGLTTIKTYLYKKSPNSMDLAIAAGTATNLDFDTVNANNPEEGMAIVDIDYDSYTYDDNGVERTAVSSIEGDILAAYGGIVDIAPKSADTVGINITGNLLAANNGNLTVNLGNGGVLTGRADDYGDAGVVDNSGHGTTFFDPAFSSEIYKGGQVNLDMGENSRWNVTGQSWITSIDATNDSGNVRNNAIIDLISANTDRNTTAHALTVYNMNGDATFNMSLDADRNVSDMLYIKNADGNYIINVVDAVTTADMYANGFDGLRFATVGEGSNANFRAVTVDQGVLNVEYEVDTDSYANNDENTAYNGGSNMSDHKPGDTMVEGFFGSNGVPGEPIETPATNGIMTLNLAAEENAERFTDDSVVEAKEGALNEVTNFKLVARKGEELSDGGKAVLNMSRANYSNAIYMDRLNKRLGEARYINDDPEEDEGMWVRIRHDRIGKEDAFRSQNTMYQLGYDKRQDCDNGERRVGFAVDYMHGDTGYTDIAGKGEIDRYGLWLYDTWMGDKGHYADYIAKWGHLDNDFEIYAPTTGQRIDGDYSNNVFSVSAEYGRKKDIGNDWYFEPQAQLQLARVTGAEYTTSQGTKVSVDGINSLIGRAGFRIGKDFGEEKQSTLYFKADVLHEFLGDQDISAMDKTTNGNWSTISYENKGTWYDIGIGYAAMMSKSSYAFIDLEQSFGNDNDDTYQINAGVRWTF